MVLISSLLVRQVHYSQQLNSRFLKLSATIISGEFSQDPLKIPICFLICKICQFLCVSSVPKMVVFTEQHIQDFFIFTRQPTCIKRSKVDQVLVLLITKFCKIKFLNCETRRNLPPEFGQIETYHQEIKKKILGARFRANHSL